MNALTGKKYFILIVLVILYSTIMLISESTTKVIRVGYSETIETMVSDINSLTAKGYGYDVFNKMEEVSDIRFEYIPVNGNLVDAVKMGLVDIAGFSIKTPSREEEVAYSNTWYSKTYGVLVSKNMQHLYSDPTTMNGKTVATYPDSIAQIFLENYAIQNNISFNYVYGNIDDYMNLDADYYITYSQYKKATELNNVLNLGVYNLFLVSTFEKQDILNNLDAIFYNVVATEGNLFLELEEKYLADNVELNHRSLTPKEVSKLKERPLNVGYAADYAPISYISDEGEAKGAMIETLRRFQDIYDFDINYFPYSLNENKELHENFDMLVTLYGDGEHDDAFYDATEAYYLIPLFAQVHLDKSERFLQNSRLATQHSTTKIGILPYQSLDFNLILNEFPGSEVIIYNNWLDLLDGFQNRDIDMMISTESSTTYAELYLDDVERATIHTSLAVPMHFYVSKNISDEYLPIMNIMLDNITESEYRGILNNNSTTFYPETTFYDFIKDNTYYVIFLIAVIVFFFFLYAHQQQQKRNEFVENAFNTDALTGLLALHKFTEKLEEKLKNSKENEYELISLDIDMFKTINTHYSNERGTKAIIAIADALRRAFTNSSALITRRTADQFMIFKKLSEGKDMQSLYEKYIIPNMRVALGERYNFSMSFGNVIISDCKEKSSAIIGHADTARLLGKNRHNTTYITFDDKMKRIYENKINITFRMERALNNKDFKVVFQPKIDFNTLKVGGAEALVRWRPDNEPQIFPDAFIPVFEENGFIFYLDMYVLEEVCIFINKNAHTIDIPKISVNLSTYTILDEKVVSTIKTIINKHNVKASSIELEVTESAVAYDEAKLLENVKILRDEGFSIAIDDFGAGVSSLNRLSAISADILKLDKAFFSLTNTAGVKSNIIISDVINMAKHLSMRVVAEGVETLDQAIWLKGINCDYAQGYYFERPLEIDTFIDLIKEDKTYDINY